MLAFWRVIDGPSRHFCTLLAEDRVAYTEYAERAPRANYVFAFDPWRPDFGWCPRKIETTSKFGHTPFISIHEGQAEPREHI